MTNHTKGTIFVVAFLIVAGFFFSPALPKQRSVAPAKPIQKKSHNLLEELAKSSSQSDPKNPRVLSPRDTRVSQSTLDTMYRMISANNRMSRYKAAKFLAEQGGEECVPYLIRALSDDSSPMGLRQQEEVPGATTTRYWANLGLIRITGQDFGFLWDASSQERDQAILEWRRWYMRNNSASSNTAPKGFAKRESQQIKATTEQAPDMIGRFGE